MLLFSPGYINKIAILQLNLSAISFNISFNIIEVDEVRVVGVFCYIIVMFIFSIRFHMVSDK